jgi:hypothetical protein
MQDEALNAQGALNEFYNDQQQSLEVLYAKLKSFAKENFPEFNTNPVTHLDIIRDSSALRSFNLPKEFTEFFVTFDTAKFLLLSDAPVVLKCEEYITHSKKSPGSQYENLFEIKKFYLKWCIEKQERETEYFALSTLNLIERNSNKENFLKFLYGAGLFIFGVKRRSIAKAFEYIDAAEKALGLSGLSDEYKTEVLYIIQLFRAFAHISSNDRENAAVALSEALVIKSDGITALLYSVLYPMVTDETQSITMRLNSIVDFDMKRFNYAVDLNNLNLFTFFLRTAITYNIFRVQEFAPYITEIRTILEGTAEAGISMSSRTYQMASDLKASPYKEFFSDKIRQDIDFAIAFLERFKNAKNLFLSMSRPRLSEKILSDVQIIKQLVQSSVYSKNMSELDFFDQQMKDQHVRIKRINDEHEQNKQVLKKRNQETIEETEKKYNAAINALESKIGSIDVSPDYDPASVFNNIMVYNVIISIVIFIIGGFIGSFGKSTSMGVSELFGSLFIYGVRWGGFVFLGGLLIALISSASKVLERTNEKHRLQKKMTGYKNQKDRALERLQKDNDRKIASLDDVNKSRVKEIHDKIDNLKSERDEREKELKELTSKEITEHFARLDLIIGN